MGGKARSRWNARAHGILSAETVITTGDGKEDPNEFQKVSDRLWGDLAPVGVVEELLVERLLTAYWRLRRVRRAENGAIRAEVEAGRSRDEQEHVERERELLEDDVPVAERGHDLVGVESQLAAIDEARAAFDDKGFLTPAEMGRVEAVTGYLVGGAAKPRTKLSAQEEEARQAELLTAFDDLRARFDTRRRELVAKGKQERECARQIASVPSEAMIARLTRYEAHLERQFFRALHELERLQLRRAGEFVPPPVKVSVDING